MSTIVTPNARAVLPVKKERILLLIPAATAVHDAMLAQVVRFPLPVPSLAEVLGQIRNLTVAQAAMGTGPTATAVRNTARNVLWSSLRSEQSYVQLIANGDAANSVEIIKSSGFDVALAQLRAKPILSAKLPGAPGVVELNANARLLRAGSTKRAMFNWQSSIDGGHTWSVVLSTVKASTTFSGMPLMTTCSFRVSITLSDITQPWSQPVSILVT